MKRTTVKLPDRLDAMLRHEAERRGITISEITREAIESHLGARDRRLLAAGAGRSGRTDISERIEEILAQEPFRPSPRTTSA
ncbi:MAG: ribbon-helix-helix protein, CopG family [Acidimicrobiia bacterium]|nr:ribbon-helix-helix protein, CopG family [Acidimicrobiia bacterium]